MPNTLSETISPPTLHEYRLTLAGREWGVLHTGVVLTWAEEQEYLKAVREKRHRAPYGVALWPSSIALAHELAARGPEGLAGKRVLELGAGTGLPGIVAASLGAHVTQTDREELALALCEKNSERNRAALGASGTLSRRLADWTAWDDTARYDLVLGSDVLYAEPLHAALRAVFAASLAPGGRVLLADPFRAPSLALLETMQADGWGVSFTKWTLGGGGGDPAPDLTAENGPRPVGVFELTPPDAG